MRSKRKEIKTLLPVCACLMTVPYAANLYAQVDNLSPSPVAGALVGDLDVTQTSPEASVGIAIENLCPQLITREQNAQNSVIQSDLRARCTDLIVDENQSGSLRQVVAEEVATQETELVELSANQLGQIASRLSALRGGIQSSIQQVSLYEDQAGSIAFQYSGPLYGGAAGDSIGDSGRIGVFINGEVSTGDKDQTVNESGFDVDASSITLGVDYRLSDGGFFGAALGVNQSESDMKNAGGSIDSDGVSVSLYGTKNIQNNSFIDATLGLAKYDYDTARNLNYTANSVSVSQRALASTDADVSFASIGIGHDAQIKQVKGLRATFSGRLNYLDASVDGFTETMSSPNSPGFGMNLEVDDQDIESLTSVLSAQFAKSINTNSGVIIPFGTVSYIHEFEDDPRVIQARFAHDPFSTGFEQSNGAFPNGTNASSNGQSVPTIISITTDAPDTDYFQIAGGVSGILPNGKNWFVSLSSTIGLDDTSYTSFTAGYRGEF